MSAAPDVTQRDSNALATLLQLARRARHAASADELYFILVNETFQLAPYRQAALLARGKVKALSGVSGVEQNAPFAQWLTKVAEALGARSEATTLPFDSTTLPTAVGDAWSEWLPAHGLRLVLPGTGAEPAVLVLAREESWTADEMALLAEWADIAAQAWTLHDRGSHHEFWWQTPQRLWRTHRLRYALIAALILLIPVRLTVLAPAELAPAHPAIVRAPLDGVVEQVLVQSNQRVKENDALFRLDESRLHARGEVARQALVTAEAEYRQQAQIAVFDAKSKARLAALQGAIEERRAEVAYVEQQLARATITAPRDGVVLFDDPGEWIGRPVATGERIATVADERDVEIEGWLAPGDLIDWPAEARVTLYLNASPLAPVSGTLRYVTYEAMQRPDGSYAYRMRATLDSGQARRRVGLKGTAKVTGNRVPLIYWVLRRPLAAARQFVGW